jgi:hypothetical protein
MEAVPPFCTAIGSSRRRRHGLRQKITASALPLKSKRRPEGMIIRKPFFDAEQQAEIDLYSLDQLRALYHAAEGAYDRGVQLRNGTVTRDQIEAEIRWRVRREERRFWFLAWMAFAAALAGSIAAVFAVLAYFSE